MSVFDHWTREILPRPRTALGNAIAELAHELVVGKPGCGKSSLLRHMIKRDIDAGDTFCLIPDPVAQLADDALADNRRHEGRIEFIDTTKPDRTFGMRLMASPSATTVGKRLTDDEDEISRVIEFVGAGSGRNVDANTMPFVRWGWHTALSLVRRFPGGADERLIPYALMPDTDHQDVLLEWHPDGMRVRKVREVNRLPSQRLTWYGPAQRMGEQTLCHPMFDAMLSVPKAPWDDWVAQHKIVIVRSHMNQPRAMRGAIMSWLRSAAVQAAFRRFDETGRACKVAIYVEEADEQWLGALDCRYMETGRKAGVKYVCVYPTVPPAETFHRLRQVVQKLVIFQQGTAQATEAMAREALAFLFDSKKVKDVQRVERAINRGTRTQEIRSRAVQFDKEGNHRGEVEQTHFLNTPDIEIVTDEHIKHFTEGEQLADLIRDIRKLQRRQCLIVSGTGVTYHTVPEVPETWPSISSKQLFLRQAVERIQSRPHYFTPTFTPPALPRAPDGPPPNPRPLPKGKQKALPPATATNKSLFERLRENGTLP